MRSSFLSLIIVILALAFSNCQQQWILRQVYEDAACTNLAESYMYVQDYCYFSSYSYKIVNSTTIKHLNLCSPEDVSPSTYYIAPGKCKERTMYAIVDDSYPQNNHTSVETKYYPYNRTASAVQTCSTSQPWRYLRPIGCRYSNNNLYTKAYCDQNMMMYSRYYSDAECKNVVSYSWTVNRPVKNCEQDKFPWWNDLAIDICYKYEISTAKSSFLGLFGFFALALALFA